MKLFQLIAIGLSASSLIADPISFNRDIRPILSENCFFCHGFDQAKREADLRIDNFEGATRDLGGYQAIAPGSPTESELITRILSTDKDDVMPPHDSPYKLSEHQKKLITQWITEGAEYEDHWAYTPIKRPELPQKAKHPIDAFLSRGWEEANVTPSPKADPRILLRRLSMDLRGLPPTMAEVASFSANPSDKALQEKAEEWLSSIEYAEHQGLLWLDLVRWADSSGMVSDEPIATGPYRRYVIESFHHNMPFDQFTREQLAGDLLPDRNDQTLTASAYNRLVKTNSEAGGIEKEALYAIKGEHVRALGTVWLGATTGCAECHDHKYDPISAKDYYSLAAFFDDLIEIGIYEPGDRRAPLHYLHEDPSQVREEHRITAEIDALRQKLYQTQVEPPALSKWLATLQEKKTLAKENTEPTDFLWFPAQLPAAHVISGVFQETAKGRSTTASPAEINRHFIGEALNRGYRGNPSALFTEVTLDPNNRPEVIALQTGHGAYQRIGWHREYYVTYYWGEKDHPSLAEEHPWIDPQQLIYLGPIPESNELIRLEVPRSQFAKPPFPPVGMGWIHIGGQVTWSHSGYVTTASHQFTWDCLEPTLRYHWEHPQNRDDRAHLEKLFFSALDMEPEKRRPIQQKMLELSFIESQKPQLVQQLNSLYREAYHLRVNAIPTLVSKTGPPKTTHVLNRGNFMDESGPLARPELPEAFAKTQPDKTLDRIDLANWLVSPENPLTARVYMNRLWHQFYGRGLSETLEDAGNQGDWPSHPHLLDWLASEFIDSGWDTKHMIRLLISAQSYQLSSIPSAELAEMDPTNRLHARQGRSRFSAEEIRDSTLLAAGLLKKTQKIPIQSSFPRQPSAYWEKSNKIMFGSRYQIWDSELADSQYHRSLYTYWKRQNIHPSMLAFDAPTRQECTARRPVTNTPAQALALLNDPAFVEAARFLAQEVCTKTSQNKRINYLFERVLQRHPEAAEAREIATLLEQMQGHFKSNPQEAQKILSIGLASPVPNHIEPSEHAAWTTICRVLLNLHEFITRS